MNKRAVIFGGSGFLGSSISNALRQRGMTVIAPKRAELDLRQGNHVRDFVAEQPSGTIFINCAAEVGSVHYGLSNEQFIVESNVEINTNICSALSQYMHDATAINFLSNCIYPHRVDVQVEDEVFNGPPHETARAFAHAKRLSMVMFDILSQRPNICVRQLILPGLFGSGNHIVEDRLHAFDGIIVRMVRAKRENAPFFEVYGSGKPVREWVPVNEVSRAVITLIMSGNQTPTVMNFSVGFHESIMETVLRVQRLLDFQGEIRINTAWADGAPVKILNNNLFSLQFPDFDFAIDVDQSVRESISYYEKNI